MLGSPAHPGWTSSSQPAPTGSSPLCLNNFLFVNTALLDVHTTQPISTTPGSRRLSFLPPHQVHLLLPVCAARAATRPPAASSRSSAPPSPSALCNSTCPGQQAERLALRTSPRATCLAHLCPSSRPPRGVRPVRCPLFCPWLPAAARGCLTRVGPLLLSEVWRRGARCVQSDSEGPRHARTAPGTPQAGRRRRCATF